MSDRHHRFGVVLASARGARFLAVFMSQVKEYDEFKKRAEKWTKESVNEMTKLAADSSTTSPCARTPTGSWRRSRPRDV